MVNRGLLASEYSILMTKEDTIEIEGVVEELLPDMRFRVVLKNNMQVIAYLCGKMRVRNIRVLIGDIVKVEMSPYDLTKARIVYRQAIDKNNPNRSVSRLI